MQTRDELQQLVLWETRGRWTAVCKPENPRFQTLFLLHEKAVGMRADGTQIRADLEKSPRHAQECLGSIQKLDQGSTLLSRVP